jgi:predicted DNA-binding transcriptional regulator YafY
VGQSPKKKSTKRDGTPPAPVKRRPEPDRRLRQAERFARILRLLELLQERSPRDARALAAALGATERTVYRDLKVLELAGVGCDYNPGLGGYVLRGDYRFAVAGLSDDELLGQATAATLTSARGLDVGQGAGPTARKIRATGREGTRSLLRDAQRVTSVLDLKLADHEGHREAIRTIQLALVGGHALEGAYASPYGTAERTILLHPIRLCLAGQAWYLIARPDGSDRPVTYRVARFRSLRKLLLRSAVPEEFDLRAYFGDAWGVYRGDRSYDVEIHFSREAADLVTETTWHRTQKVQRHRDGSVTLSFRVDGLNEIVHWLLGWSGRATVIRPPELRELVVEYLHKALSLNQAKPDQPR